ncbi:MAG: hypothetical protein ABIO39_14610 [Caulobacteraceae bacterium]
MVSRLNTAPVRRRLAYAICALAGVAAATPVLAQSDDDWLPTRSQVAHVQAVIAPTPTLAPIKARNQYWAGMNQDGRRVIFGVLVKRELDVAHRKPGGPAAVEIRALSAMPGFFNYGCDAVFVMFDVADDRLDRLFCSGGQDLKTHVVSRSGAPFGGE